MASKREQALAALRFAVNSMGPEDELNIVDYATTVEVFAEAPVKITDQTRAAALEYIDGIEALGGHQYSRRPARGDEHAGER